MKIRVLKTIVAAVIALTLALLSMPVSFAATSGTTENGIKWSYDESTGTLTLSGKGTVTDDIWVEADGEFSYFSVKNLVAKDGITGFETNLFEYCFNITNITLPDTVQYIDKDTFANTGIYKDSTNWENGVLYIGKFLVKANTDLSGAYKIKDGTKVICEYAFNCCLNLTDVTIPESVTTIDERAFQGCEALTSVEIPDGVKTIEEGAFNSCKSLASVSIGNGVTRIGNSAFDGTKVITDESNWENGVLYIGNYLIGAKGSSFGDYTMTIKDGTKVIASRSFASYEGLTGVTIPDSVISIGGGAFDDTGIYNDPSNWENDVLYIGDCLIAASKVVKTNTYERVSLSGDYKIKDGTRVIADDAFAGCTNLTSVAIPESVITIGEKAFRECDSMRTIVLPKGITKIEKSTFYDCDNLYSITIGNKVASIDNLAFYYCYSLSQVNYGGSEAEWNKISIGAHNDYLMSATKNFAQNTPGGSVADGNSSASNSSNSGSEKTSDGNGAVVVIVVVAVGVVIAAAGVTFVIIKKKKS